jgi:hypothetical protein
MEHRFSLAMVRWLHRQRDYRFFNISVATNLSITLGSAQSLRVEQRVLPVHQRM